MKTKLSKLKNAAACGNWREAVRIAARFADLGEHKGAITRAWEAYSRPAFLIQLKRDPDACIAAGISALKIRYGI